jgi:hypothetical protein
VNVLVQAPIITNRNQPGTNKCKLAEPSLTARRTSLSVIMKSEHVSIHVEVGGDRNVTRKVVEKTASYRVIKEALCT